MNMKNVEVICPLCKSKLMIDKKHAICENNHNFDRAKSGYLNLLLNYHPSGDNEMMINARNAFLSKGYFRPLLDNIITLLKEYEVKSLLDVGSGEGYYSRHIYDALKIPICGVDISKYACLKASKLSKDVLYLVASNYDLPLADKSFDAIINIFAPHSEEFERVCRKLIIKVVPNSHHLWELKTLLYDDPYIKESNEGDFVSFIKKSEVYLTYKIKIEKLDDLIKMTPYYYKSKIDNAIFDYNDLEMTMDFKIILYESRGIL